MRARCAPRATGPEPGDGVLVHRRMCEPGDGHSSGDQFVWCWRVNAYRAGGELAVLGDDHFAEPG